MNDNSDIIQKEFSERLEYAIIKLKNLKSSDSSVEQKVKISEYLHNEIIKQLRKLLGDYLEKKDTVAILVDNLDKAWEHNIDKASMSKFIFGLLDVGDSIMNEFSKESYWRRPINISLIIFLRDDIHSQISEFRSEQDKLPIKNILWEDPKMLIRVIEERILYALNLKNPNVNIWRKYFCTDIMGKDIKEYLTVHIIPKPRDIITLVKTALNNAKNRKHIIITEEDILDAHKEYSKNAFLTLKAESGISSSQMDNILLNFMGRNELITLKEIENDLQTNLPASISSKDMIALLCRLSFLGIETSKDKFLFIYDSSEYRRIKVILERAENNPKNEIRFKIHKAFHSYLDIISD